MIKQLFFIFLVTFSLSASSSQIQLPPTTEQLETFENQNIQTHVRIYNPPEDFQLLGLNPFDFDRYIKEIVNLFNTTFQDEITNNNENKMLVIKFEIYGKPMAEDICIQNYKNCSITAFSIIGKENFNLNKITTFESSIYQIDEIKITNNNLKNKITFIIYLNTQPKNELFYSFPPRRTIIEKPL